MQVTSKGRRWEILHSLWIGWTFTLGFFNWIAFLYIGLRTRQTKWFVWGLFYSTTFVLAMIFADTPAFEGWIGDLTIAFTLLLGAISIVHAFMIRKEYLMRLDALQEGAAERSVAKDAALKRQIEGEYKPGAPEEASRPADSSGLNRDRSTANLAEAETSSPGSNSNLELVDLGRDASETSDIRSGLTHSLEEYPLPLAFGYGLLTSKWDPRERYREQLRFAENILAFLASVSLASLRESDYQEAQIDFEKYWRGGISPGDWKDIIGRCSKVFAQHDNNTLASSMNKLNVRSEKKGFGKDIAELISEKNDYKHDRGPVVEEDIIVASNKIQEKLDRCTESLSFFTDYPIRLVQDFDVSRQGHEFILKCLRYTGDGPGFPQEKIAFRTALPRGDLFLDLGNQEWLPLYPFVTAMNCPRCKFREIYFMDG